MHNDINKGKQIKEESQNDSHFNVEEQEVFSSLILSDKLKEKHQTFLSKTKETKEDLAKKINKNNIKSKINKLIKPRKIEKPQIKFSYKSTLVLATIIVALLVGLRYLEKTKAETEALTQNAEDHIWATFSYVEAGDITNAISEADLAKNDLTKIKLTAQSLGQDNHSLKLIAPDNSKLVANERLLNAAYLIMSTLSDVSSTMTTLTQTQNEAIKYTDGSNKIFLNIKENQKTISDTISKSKSNINLATISLDNAKNGVEAKTRNQIETAEAALLKTSDWLDFIDVLINKDLDWLSGTDGNTKNILILFQNNSELRGASGGSLGSFGVARFKDGALQNIDFGKNIFKIDQAFEKTNRYYEPPNPIKFLRGDKTWTLKDSGWDVSGPEAMKNIEKFYYIETGEKVDGVFMIDSTVIINLLKKIGPINLPAYNKTITSENFKNEIETEVHKDYFTTEENLVENEPKKIIADMMPIFLDKTFSALGKKNTAVEIFKVFSDSLKQKDMTMYFNKIDFQDRIEKLNYSGKINTAYGDYLSITNSNIDGGKSSLNIKEDISLKVTINSKGQTQNELNIKRTHIGDGVWPDNINRNYSRVLLPENSNINEFLPVAGNFEQMTNKGFENDKIVDEEKSYGKKILSYWMSTNPKETSQTKIKYNSGLELDTNTDFMYDLLLQKQVGANADDITLEILYPDGFIPINVKKYDEKNHKITLKLTLKSDKEIKINFSKIN